MADITIYTIFAGIVLILVILKFGPSRGDLWQAVENWAADNRIAARVREGRRAERKALRRQESEFDRLITAVEAEETRVHQ